MGAVVAGAVAAVEVVVVACIFLRINGGKLRTAIPTHPPAAWGIWVQTAVAGTRAVLRISMVMLRTRRRKRVARRLG